MASALDAAEDVREILKVYLGTTQVPPEELPRVVKQVFEVWKSMLLEEKQEDEPEPVKPEETIRGEKLLCLEDGREVVLLRKHLAKHFDMTPEDYIAKWKLPADYPMVSPEYSRKRRQIAKKHGLGKLSA